MGRGGLVRTVNVNRALYADRFILRLKIQSPLSPPQNWLVEIFTHLVVPGINLYPCACGAHPGHHPTQGARSSCSVHPL